MTDTTGRLFGILCVLAGLWIATYWLYEPRGGGGGRRVTRDGDSGSALAAAPPTAPPTPTPTAPDPNADTARQPPDNKPLAAAPPVESSAPAAPRTRLIPPRFRDEVIQPGDNGWHAIAKRVYGDSSKWQVIARANPLVSSDRLYLGRTIRIPIDEENIQGKVVVEDAPVSDTPTAATPAPSPGTAGTGTTVTPPPQTPPAPPAEQQQTYLIRQGDTLWSIARRFYGAGAEWERLYEANKDVISDANRPIPGTTIVIPKFDRGEVAGDGGGES